MQKSDFFCIFLSGRAASTTNFPSQAPLETKKGGSPALIYFILPTNAACCILLGKNKIYF